MPHVNNIFDIIGPIMIGPSSSHSAGAVRLGRLARSIVGVDPKVVEIQLHGSFAATADGHGTKLAIAAGLMGWDVDDERIVDALEIASSNGYRFTFSHIDLENAHPNTASFIIETEYGRETIQGSSTGGGNVVVTEIDRYPVELFGVRPTFAILHHDRPGVISTVTTILARSNSNIASMRVSRTKRGSDALMLIKLDHEPPSNIQDELSSIESVFSVRYIPSLEE